MPLLYIGISFVFLLFLMLRLKFNAFFALLLAAVLAGFLNSMPLAAITISVSKGVGDTMGSLVLILCFGAMLGKLLEESGAAYRITYTIINTFGKGRIQLAILVAGFIIGLPMMYNASFLVMIPIVYSFSFVSRIPLMQLGIPLSASLSVAHAFLPPHPAPIVVSEMYGADINAVFLYGLLFSVPAIVLSGMLMPRFFRHVNSMPPENLFRPPEYNENTAPDFYTSLFCAIFPFILISLGAVIPRNSSLDFLRAIGSPEVALLLSVLLGLFLLGTRRGKNMNDLMNTLGSAASSVAMIVLIIAAGGAFKQVLIDSGVSEYIKTITADLTLNPLLLGWFLAAFIRLAIGSATVATITAASILIPVVRSSEVSVELMVLATGSGSLMFSHFNDIGFWMFKEYYNVTIKETFAIWTVMESIVGTVGLAGCLIADFFLR